MWVVTTASHRMCEELVCDDIRQCILQRTLTVGRSITVRLTSCLTGLDLTKQLKKWSSFVKGDKQPDRPNGHTCIECNVATCMLHRFLVFYNHNLPLGLILLFISFLAVKSSLVQLLLIKTQAKQQNPNKINRSQCSLHS